VADASELRRRLLWTLLAPLAGLLAAELLVRAAGWAPLPQPHQEGPNFEDSDDATLRYVNRPDSELAIPFVDAPGAEPRVVRARINADGFRGPRIERERTSGVARVACVGGSHTFGWGVGDDETWPAVLARAVAPVEVLNAGVNGYDAEQEARFLEREVLPWRPDLVLWQFFLNDAGMRGMALEPGQEAGWLLRVSHPSRAGVVGALRARWRTLDLVLDRLWRRGALELYGDARNIYYREDAEGWRRCRAALLGARDASRAAGARFAIVLVPFLHGERGALASGAAHAFVARFCEQEGIPVLDLDPVLSPHEPAELRVHPAEYHANARAYALMGEAIADWLRKAQLLP
jgi:lysophospholipase L1-like esterase